MKYLHGFTTLFPLRFTTLGAFSWLCAPWFVDRAASVVLATASAPHELNRLPLGFSTVVARAQLFPFAANRAL